MILISPGFELDQVVAWTGYLRSRGRRVCIVSLTSGPIRSRDGIRLLADSDLDEAADNLPGLVLLPGGAETQAWLVRDPRVSRYLEDVNKAGGRIGAAEVVQLNVSEVELTGIPDSAACFDVLDAIWGGKG